MMRAFLKDNRGADWADTAQRDRAFAMIHTDTVSYYRARNARIEHQRRVAISLLLAAASLWVAVTLGA